MIISVLIADDEPNARRYLKGFLEAKPEVGSIIECKNGGEVLKILNEKTPDLIFLDINMPGINGIEVAEKLKNGKSIVIFSTAYDQYAIKAFELKVFDYLLKPFDENRFVEVFENAVETIDQIKQAEFGQKFANLYHEYNQTLTPHLTEIVIKERGFTRKIRLHDIACIESSSIYAILHLESKNILYRVSLNLLEEQLPPSFIRIHRSYIVNKDWLAKISYLNNNTYQFELNNGMKITSSRSYKETIRSIFY